MEKNAPAKAKDMIMSGRQVRAPEALAMGLVDDLAGPADDALSAAHARVREYLAARGFVFEVRQ